MSLISGLYSAVAAASSDATIADEMQRMAGLKRLLAERTAEVAREELEAEEERLEEMQ